MRTKKCGRGVQEFGGASQAILWILLSCVVLGAGFFVLQKSKTPEMPPQVAVATPEPATPTPPPATPEPVVVKATPTPTPPPVAVATPPPPSPATPPPLDFATVVRTPALWPPQIALVQAMPFPINLNGRVVGEAKAAAGTVLRVLRLNGAQVEVEFQGGRHWIPVNATDFMPRATAIFRANGSTIPTSVATTAAPAPMMATATPTPRPGPTDDTRLADRIVLEVVRNRRSRIEGGDWDDKTERIEMKVKLANPDTKMNAEKWRGEIYVFAESILDRSALKVLIAQTFDISIPARGNQEFITEQVTTMYDTTDARFGYKYDGWAFRAKDSSGKTLIAKASSPTLQRCLEGASELRKDVSYDKNSFKEKMVVR